LLITIQTIGRGAAGPEKGGDVRANQGSRRSKAAGGDAGGTNRNGRNGPGSSMLNSRDDDSSFGSSESELDVGEIMGMSGMSNIALGAGDDDCKLTRSALYLK